MKVDTHNEVEHLREVLQLKMRIVIKSGPVYWKLASSWCRLLSSTHSTPLNQNYN